MTDDEDETIVVVVVVAAATAGAGIATNDVAIVVIGNNNNNPERRNVDNHDDNCDGLDFSIVVVREEAFVDDEISLSVSRCVAKFNENSDDVDFG